MNSRIYTKNILVLTSAVLLMFPIVGQASDQVFIDTAQIQIIGAHADDHLGASTSGAGDVNGDGIPDIVAGAPGSDNRSHNTGGKAYVILGSSSPATELDLLYSHPGSVIVIDGAPGGSMLGASVSGAGDVNGDGFDDYIIGAPGASSSDPTEEEAGRAYIIYGSANPPGIVDVSNLGTAGVEIIGAREGAHLGASVSGARDFDGDGFSDVLIGAPEDSNDSLEVCGSAFLIRGSNTLPSTIDLKNSHGNVTIFRSGGPNQEVGSCVADLEDFNGDGNPDIAIASMRHSDDSHANAGRAWIIYGGSTPPAEVDLTDIAASGLTSTTIRIPQANHELGQSISCAGDSDADGDTELLISRSLHDHNPETIATVAYLVRGGFSPPAEINLANPAPWITQYTSFYDNDEEGQSVHTTLDFSGDGIDDHIIGISRSILLDVEKGMAHRVDGGQNHGESQLLDLFQHEGRGYLGLQEDQEVGISVGAAGDFNADRGNDLLIGAAGSKPYGRYMAGSVYVFLGQKLRSPNNVETVCLGQTVDVTWNNRAVYDEVDLFKDGVLLATLPGGTEAYTDSGVAYGDHNYSVRGRRRGINTVKRSSDIQVLIPIAALDCTSLHRDISISWTNSDNYDLIDLYRDGVLQSTVPGGSTSYHDNNVSSGIHQYSVVERGDRTTTLSTGCSITALMPPYIATCSAAPDAQNQIIATINWNLMPNPSGFQLINIYRDGSHIQTLAGDATTTQDLISAGRFHYEIEGVADDGRAVSARATCDLEDPISVKQINCSADVDVATFSWINTDAYDYIIIEFGPGDGSTTPTEIDQIPGNSQSYTTLIQNGPGDYSVCVRGVKFTGESGRTCCTLTVPAPLGALNCSATGSSVFLAWTNGGAYDSVAIRRDGFLIGTISGTSTSYTDEDVSFGDRSYSITAQRRQSVSAAQSCGLTVLRKPAALTCKGEGDQVRLNWQNPAPAYDQIEVMRGSTVIATLSGTASEYIDAPLAAGDFSYTLRGIKGSSESNPTHCTTVIPEAITTLGTGLVDGTHMLLTWAPTEDATSIRIFRDGLVIATLPASSTSYIDPTLDPGTYQYCLRARIDNNHSTDTCTPAIVPAPPIEINCGVDSSIATISWTNSEAYDNVILKRDGGTILEDLDGLANSYVDSIAGPGPHLYEVSGRIGDH
ncbi:MAG: integrin alpha, partial [Planctomycetota bacterium]|nr:integrin alpha [Planctomycetota bacterium]